MSDKPMIPYRITIELATGHRPGEGMTISFTGETPDIRGGDDKPSNYECTAMVANVLAWHANQAAEVSTDQRTFEQSSALLMMPVHGKPN